MTDGILTRAAAIGPSSLNEADHSFEMVFATDALINGHRLAITPENVSRATGVSLLDSHMQRPLSSVIGVVGETSIVGNEARARIRMSSRAEALWQDVVAGIIRGGSVGYVVEEMTTTKENGKKVNIAKRWHPREISLTAVPADPNATIRSKEMEIENQVEPNTTQTDPPPPITENRAAVNGEIRGIAKVAGLPVAFSDAQIDAGATIAEAQAAAFAAMRVRSEATAAVRTATASVNGHDSSDPEWCVRTIGEAVFARMSGVAPSEAARPYASLTMVELAKDRLRARGMQTTGNPATVVERAMNMTMSDLPNIMADSVNRTLRMAYEAAPSGVRQLARQTTARDFRMKHRIQLSAAPTLLPVNENGEFHSGAIADTEETYRISTFGRIISLSRAAFVNDDLGALNDLTRRMGLAAANFENQFLTDLVQTNPVLKDTFAVFSSQHSNLAATGTVLSQDSLSAARLAMRKQTEMTGVLINVTPKFLLVPAALETAAEKIVTSIQAVQTDFVNVMDFLSVRVEPRLTSQSAWYLVADPAGFDGIEYAYMEGEAGPQTFSEIGFVVDGVSFKIREDFGGGWVEPRGWYRNNGA